MEARVALTLAAEAEPAFFKILLDSAKAALERAREDSRNAWAVRLNDGSAFDVRSFRLQDETRLLDARQISVLRRIADYDGGAEILLRVETFAFDRVSGRRLTLEALFGDLGADSPALQALRKAAIDRLAPVKAERLRIVEAEAREALDAALPPDARALRFFSLAPSDEPGAIGGLSLHFAPHEIGAGQEGEYEALIPQEAFRAFLAPEWRERFAGSPLTLTRLLSAEGFSGALFGIEPGAAVSAPFRLRGEAPRAFFRDGPARLEIAPEQGGGILAKAFAEPLEAPPSGAVEEGVAFAAVFESFAPARPGSPLTLSIIAAGPADETARKAPDRMSLSLKAGPQKAAEEKPSEAQAGP